MSTLGSWLKGEGFTVDDDDVPYGRESTWRGVEYIVCHHTVSPCDGPESSIVDYCKHGGSGTYPPLCQIVLGHSGKVWMTCRERSGQPDPGRASHAGSGSGYGIPDDTMNERSLGIECQCDGTHPISTHATQYRTLIELLAALCRRYDVPVEHVIGHKEWSSTGKVDPRDDMDRVRAEVQAELDTYWQEDPMPQHLYLNQSTPRALAPGGVGSVQWAGGNTDTSFPTYSLKIPADGMVTVTARIGLARRPDWLDVAIYRPAEPHYEKVRSLLGAVDVADMGRGIYAITAQGQVEAGDLVRLDVRADAAGIDILDATGILSVMLWMS